MATFLAQVNGLTNLAIDGSSTDPSDDELSQFLKDGVIDVTNRCISMNPRNKEDFLRATSTTSTNGLSVEGDVISVIREAEADGDADGSTVWRECKKIPISQQSRVVDVDSLHFASKYNPVYIVNNNGAINVYPVPDGTDDGYRVYYVNNDPKGDGISDTLAAGHSSIGYFPNDKEYLVILYASVKTLEAAAANKIIAQDVELQQSYSQQAASLKAEYMSNFQQQQQQQQQPQQQGRR